MFHYLLWQDVATEYASADKYWAPYAATSAIFAKRIAEIYKPGDLIWVHDYHLLLVPKLLRQLIPEAVIGLFVHTPWPSSEVFRCLPRQSAYLSSTLSVWLTTCTIQVERKFSMECSPRISSASKLIPTRVTSSLLVFEFAVTRPPPIREVLTSRVMLPP